ncbi:Dual specificity protein phosphatase 22, partial [Eschrichtius robustus]|nr:Dual specificity protein phosphatase 22 [Eschrichtius robustus]
MNQGREKGVVDKLRVRRKDHGVIFMQDLRVCKARCLAGVSRSVTLVVAYIMTVTDFGWEDALRTVRAGRSCANPNLGFQRQLQEFEERQVRQ